MSAAEKKLETAPLPQAAQVWPSRGQMLDSLAMRVVRGDTESFNEIVADTKRYVSGVARRYLKDAGLVEDACQECYLRAFMSLRAYKPKGTFLPWIARIAANVCLGMLNGRQYGCHCREVADQEALDAAHCPDSRQAETDVLRREYAGLIHRAMAALSRQERLAVDLCCLQELMPIEAASIMGVEHATIRGYLAAAKRKMKIYLERTFQKERQNGSNIRIQ